MLEPTAFFFERARIGKVGRRLEAGDVAIGDGGSLFPKREAWQLLLFEADAQSSRAVGSCQQCDRTALGICEEIAEINLFGKAGFGCRILSPVRGTFGGARITRDDSAQGRDEARSFAQNRR